MQVGECLNSERIGRTIEDHYILKLELFEMTYFRQGGTARNSLSFKELESKSNYCWHSFFSSRVLKVSLSLCQGSCLSNRAFAGQVLNYTGSKNQEFYCIRL